MNSVTLSSSYSRPPPPLPLPEDILPTSPFKPTIVVLIALLSAMLSVSLLLLLYAKHCKRDHIYTGGSAAVSRDVRINSGIDRAVIDSLPVLTFSSLTPYNEELECSVCLTPFEPTHAVRLLPRCKHAFHIECVDTWLSVHSTCPLCRYRVHSEDILLIDPRQDTPLPNHLDVFGGGRRFSGRHSSAGEDSSRFALSSVVDQRPSCSAMSEQLPETDKSFKRRKSMDDTCNWCVTVGCLDKYHQSRLQRKDKFLVFTNNSDTDDEGDDNIVTCVNSPTFKHTIIVSANRNDRYQHQEQHDHRWSDLHPSDLLYLRSEFTVSDGHRFSMATGSAASAGNRQKQRSQNAERWGETSGDGTSVINLRSVSEITGLNRFSDRGRYNSRRRGERQAGVVSRWLAWISSQSHNTARSFCATSPSTAPSAAPV